MNSFYERLVDQLINDRAAAQRNPVSTTDGTASIPVRGAGDKNPMPVQTTGARNPTGGRSAPLGTLNSSMLGAPRLDANPLPVSTDIMPQFIGFGQGVGAGVPTIGDLVNAIVAQQAPSPTAVPVGTTTTTQPVQPVASQNAAANVANAYSPAATNSMVKSATQQSNRPVFNFANQTRAGNQWTPKPITWNNTLAQSGQKRKDTGFSGFNGLANMVGGQ